MATHSNILVWGIPWREEPGGLQCMRSQKVRHDWATNSFTSVSIIHSSNIMQGLYLSWRWISLNFFPGKATTCSVQFSSVAQSCPTLCDPMNHSTPGLPVHHQLLEFTQTHVHWVSDAIQPSHPLSSPSPPAPNSSQHQSLFQWVSSSHEVTKVLEFQL